MAQGTKPGWSEDMDVQAHVSTYSAFITASIWGSVFVAVILILMAIFLL